MMESFVTMATLIVVLIMQYMVIKHSEKLRFIWDGMKDLIILAFRYPTTIIERLKGNKLDAEIKRLNGILETEIERGKKLEAELILLEKIESRREHNDNTLKRYEELLEAKAAEKITEGE